jgi:hypothetical protein
MKWLSDYKPGERPHQRARRERQAREAVLRKRRKPQPLPKGWEPPF